jgi:predicted oxidoreductase
MKRSPKGSSQYIRGKCHVFALALNDEFGYKMYALEDRNREIYNDRTKKSYPLIVHTFAKKGNKVVDARGVRSLNTVKSECTQGRAKPDWKVHEVTKKTIMHDRTYKNTYDKVSKTSLNKAGQYIRKNKDRYD